MKTYFHNGEGWYCNDRSLIQRIRTWLIWFGGWELANGKGWRFTLNIPGRPWWQPYFMSPWPLSILGHWLTIFGWGLNFKVKGGWFVWVWNENHGKRIYLSANGTPAGAWHWISGAPYEVLKSAADRQLFHKDEQLEFERRKSQWTN